VHSLAHPMVDPEGRQRQRQSYIDRDTDRDRGRDRDRDKHVGFELRIACDLDLVPLHITACPACL
jgi:hypothetical protein